jgi:hypothetical protein
VQSFSVADAERFVMAATYRADSSSSGLSACKFAYLFKTWGAAVHGSSSSSSRFDPSSMQLSVLLQHWQAYEDEFASRLSQGRIVLLTAKNYIGWMLSMLRYLNAQPATAGVVTDEVLRGLQAAALESNKRLARVAAAATAGSAGKAWPAAAANSPAGAAAASSPAADAAAAAGADLRLWDDDTVAEAVTNEALPFGAFAGGSAQLPPEAAATPPPPPAAAAAGPVSTPETAPVMGQPFLSVAAAEQFLSSAKRGGAANSSSWAPALLPKWCALVRGGACDHSRALGCRAFSPGVCPEQVLEGGGHDEVLAQPACIC